MQSKARDVPTGCGFLPAMTSAACLLRLLVPSASALGASSRRFASSACSFSASRKLAAAATSPGPGTLDSARFDVPD